MSRLSITLSILVALSACQSTTVAKVEQNEQIEQSKEVKKSNCSSAPSTGSRVKRKAC
jgi:hypothetical protein